MKKPSIKSCPCCERETCFAQAECFQIHDADGALAHSALYWVCQYCGCEWREYTELTKDPVIIAQEYDIDYQASVEGLVIEKEWIKSAVDFGLNWEGPRYGGFDLASSGKNKSVYIARTGPVAHLPREMAFRTSTEAIWGSCRPGRRR